MMRTVHFVFLSGFAVAQEPSGVKLLDLEALVRTAGSSVAAIRVYGSGEAMISEGTGFVARVFADGVGFRCLVTNRHVLRGASRAEAVFPTQEPLALRKVIAEDIRYDLVFVDIDGLTERVSALEVKPALPSVGAQVAVIGNPAGLSNSVSDGIVSAVRDLPHWGEVVQITAPISPGSSGSPVFDAAGKVIGVATFQSAAGQNLNFAVPSIRLAGMKRLEGIELSKWAGVVMREERQAVHDVPRKSVPGDVRSPSFWLDQAETCAKRTPGKDRSDALHVVAESWMQHGHTDRCAQLLSEAIAIDESISGNPSPDHYTRLRLYVAMGDMLAADMYMVKERPHKINDKIGMYCYAVRCAHNAGLASRPEVQDWLRTVNIDLDRVPMAKLNEWEKEYSPGALRDRLRALEPYVDTVVALRNLERAAAVRSEVATYRNSSPKQAWLLDGFLCRHDTALAYAHLAVGDIERALQFWTKVDCMASGDGRSGGNEYLKGMRRQTDVLRVQIASKAFRGGHAESVSAFRRWVLSRLSEESLSECGAAVAALLMETGDTDLATKVARSDKAALGIIVKRLAETGQLARASQLLPFVDGSLRVESAIAIAEASFDSGDAAAFSNHMSQVQKGFEGLKSWEKPLVAKRLGALVAKSRDESEVWLWWESLGFAAGHPMACIALGIADYRHDHK